MDILKINEILTKEPGYRIKQAYKAVFVDMVDNWQAVTVLSKDLREKLSKKANIEIKAQELHSGKNDTIKVLFGKQDKYEAVLMKHKERNTVCISTQVGCAMACVFCATGKLGFKRNLSAWELVEQVLYFARLLKKINEKVNNVVLMGMGEPFLNYDNVMDAIKILNDREGLNIGARKISISTVGIVPGIKRLSKEKLQVNLALSLHSVKDEKRNKLMPINNEYKIDLVLKAIKNYITFTNRKVFIEYIMLRGVNDSTKDAESLVFLLNKYLPRGLFTINIIRYNKTSDFSPSTNKDIINFKAVLKKANIDTIERYRFGEDIKAACGQLAGAIDEK